MICRMAAISALLFKCALALVTAARAPQKQARLRKMHGLQHRLPLCSASQGRVRPSTRLGLELLSVAQVPVCKVLRK